MNRFADIANQAKSEHQQTMDAAAAAEAERDRIYQEAQASQRRILEAEILPIFEEARAGFVAAGLPAVIEREPENFNNPKVTLKISRKVDTKSRPFDVTSELSGTVELGRDRIRLSRSSFSESAKVTYATIGAAEEAITSQITLVAQAWFAVNETFAGR